MMIMLTFLCMNVHRWPCFEFLRVYYTWAKYRLRKIVTENRSLMWTLDPGNGRVQCLPSFILVFAD